MIDSKLLDLLACPVCREDLEYDAKNEKLTCTACGKIYPVVNGIPVLIVEETASAD
jgi:hypothetical protein